MKINWKPVKDFAELVGGIAAYVILVAATGKAMECVHYESDNTTAHYDDAVSAIMKSDMYSHDKADAAAALKRIASSEFYKAIIHIAEDNSVYSHDKANMIKALSEN